MRDGRSSVPRHASQAKSTSAPPAQRSTIVIKGGMSATAGRLGLFVTGGGRGRVLDVEPSLGTFGGLHYAAGFNAWNAGASWRVRGIGDLYARVENLFDERYEEALGFPALGRRATVELRVAAGR